MPGDDEFENLRAKVPGFADLSAEEQDQRYAAHLFMKDAHKATAEDFVAFAESFDRHAIRRGEEPTGSRMRQAGAHLYHAASLDPFTELQDGLHGSNQNKYANNGGFIAMELEYKQTRKQREENQRGTLSVMGGQGGSKSMEFHPPGGTHVRGEITDVHGSYIRPRNAGRARAMSIGVASAEGSGQVKLPGDNMAATTEIVATRVASSRKK
ncbi:hypothetical protein [Pseudoduganella rhizocola]|uniref:hypothetical protein n=1 Tax=Pseudoduganella rhizocola TaxID=3382643 RepID=UPI0038B5A22D